MFNSALKFLILGRNLQNVQQGPAFKKLLFLPWRKMFLLSMIMILLTRKISYNGMGMYSVSQKKVPTFENS